MIQRREDESVTAFTVRRMTAEIITNELEDLANCFEGAADTHATWTALEIADTIRERLKNHPFEKLIP